MKVAIPHADNNVKTGRVFGAVLFKLFTAHTTFLLVKHVVPPCQPILTRQVATKTVDSILCLLGASQAVVGYVCRGENRWQHKHGYDGKCSCMSI